MDQSNLLKKLVEFNDTSRPRTAEGKDKRNTYESANPFCGGQELV